MFFSSKRHTKIRSKHLDIWIVLGEKILPCQKKTKKINTFAYNQKCHKCRVYNVTDKLHADIGTNEIQTNLT